MSPPAKQLSGSQNDLLEALETERGEAIIVKALCLALAAERESHAPDPLEKLSVKQGAVEAGIALPTFYKLVERGSVKHTRVGRKILVLRRDLPGGAK